MVAMDTNLGEFIAQSVNTKYFTFVHSQCTVSAVRCCTNGLTARVIRLKLCERLLTSLDVVRLVPCHPRGPPYLDSVYNVPARAFSIWTRGKVESGCPRLPGELFSRQCHLSKKGSPSRRKKGTHAVDNCLLYANSAARHVFFQGAANYLSIQQNLILIWLPHISRRLSWEICE